MGFEGFWKNNEPPGGRHSQIKTIEFNL